MKLIVTYCFVVCSLIGFSKGEFKLANEAYEKGDYTLAIDTYSKIISEGKQSADLFYNLGDAYYKNNELGKSIWAFESALKLDPNHEDALFNLEFANAQTDDKIDTSHHGLKHWMKGFLYTENINLWAYISIGCSVLFAVFAFIFFKSNTRKARNISIFLGGFFGMLLIASILIGYFHKNSINTNTFAVIVSEKSLVKMSPVKDAKISFTLGEGAKVEMLKSEKNWLQIEVNGNRGWLLKKTVWEI